MNRITLVEESFSETVRVEVVDTAHRLWPKTLRAVVRTGGAESLLICDDGRLSTRQTVLAAVRGDEVVGHLAFRIEPAAGRSVRARVDSFAVEPGEPGDGIEQLLTRTAERQAAVRQCRPPVAVPVAC
jgi:hypothetical protein